MYRLLFVVHRYGYPGGSENNVKWMAEEALRQGHDVTVLADTNTGDMNGVKVTADRSVAFQKWDMIITHGSCPTQDFIHSNEEIGRKSPVYYLIVEPPKNYIAQNMGTKNAKWIGYGTSFDLEFIKSKGMTEKAHSFVYGIPYSGGENGFKERYNIPKNHKLYLSAGGFWPHKRMGEIAEVFTAADLDDVTLVLLGYDNRHGPMPQSSDRVLVLLGSGQQDVYDAMLESSLYILNSEAEGYGLVLLEAMANGCPWISRDIAAGHDLAMLGFGQTFSNTHELLKLMIDPPRVTVETAIADAEYVQTFHSIEHSVKNLLSVL